MFPFRGNINGSVDSLALNLPASIDYFSLVNKASGTIGVNVYLVNSLGSQICIAPLNLQLAAGEMYEGTGQVVLLATEVIRVHSSGSTDFNFTLNNTEAPEVIT